MILIISENSEMLHFCPCEMLLHLQFLFQQKFTKLVIQCPSVVLFQITSLPKRLEQINETACENSFG